MVEALNRDNVVVGCVITSQPGQYPLMQIYGESLPSVPGMRANEFVKFRVNGIPVVANPSLYWRNDSTQHTVDLALGSVAGQCRYLSPAWNLMSFQLRPTAPPVNDVLRSIKERYCKVFGELGIYDCAIDPTYHTLKELQPGLSYWLQVTGTTGINLRVEGVPTAITTPLPLHRYWNWVGYLPTGTLPITAALSSIAGHYQMVLSFDKTYVPNDLEGSTLWTMEPGQGYQILATDAVTLTYPLTSTGNIALPNAPTRSDACPSLAPRPDFMLLRGQLTVDGAPAPAGSRVEIVTPRGETAGCFVIQHDGVLGYTRVFGEDQSIGAAGFHTGDRLSFRVDGRSAVSSQPIEWRSDLATVPVDLIVSAFRVYLPIAFK